VLPFICLVKMVEGQKLCQYHSPTLSLPGLTGYLMKGYILSIENVVHRDLLMPVQLCWIEDTCMSSTDHRQSSATRRQGFIRKPFDLPNRVNQPSPEEQSPLSATVAPPTAEQRQGGASPRQGLIKNPMQPIAKSPSLPNTAPLPDTGTLTRPSLIKNPLILPDAAASNTVPPSLPMPQRNDISPRMTRPLSEPITPTSPFEDPETSPRVTRHLPEMKALVTRTLTNDQTGALPVFLRGTTSARQPVVIPATEKRRGTSKLEPPEPPRKRHWRQIVVSGVIAVIILGTLLSVVPVDKAGDHLFNPFQPISNLIPSTGGNPSSLAQQDATATVTHQDGYDPGTGVVLAPGSASDHFAFGQCTYYASMRYHQLTGYWVPWLGNAYQWSYAASAFGWIVSSKPRVPSIIVLQPGVQYAGWYGHVAIVESINPDGSVSTSNWNWYGPGGGGWARLSVVTFHPGPGVSFVWHP
jgi:surface antigen